MNQIEKILYDRLGKNGIGRSLVPGFLRILANVHPENASLNHSQVQARLRYLGWGDIDLDYHTWQLAEACLVTGVPGTERQA